MLQTLLQRLTLDADDARSIIERTFGDHPTHHFGFRLWNGQQVRWGDRQDFTLVFTEAETFRRCFVSRDPAEFAEAYADGRMLIEGDLWSAVGIASYLRTLKLGFGDKVRFAPKLVLPATRHTVEHDRRDVQAHYDLSDEFFRLFLDEKMVYSCAYFASPDQSLDRAQERKLDLICKKLGLRPGDSFLDVGCGWGALLIWAARHYGVWAHGITLSDNQAAEARQRVAQAGLSDRVTIELRHYAELPAEAFDKVSSVGMYEHVGIPKLPSYFRAMYRSLRPGGLFLNHGITSPDHGVGTTGGEFIFRQVFPGADLAPVLQLQTEMERARFETLDVHSLRPHYSLTLREWFRRFRARRDEAARLVPERVLRIWELYLAGCSQAFDDNVLSIHQILAAKPDRHGRAPIPLVRPDTILGSEPDGMTNGSRH
ncbi:MAG TPA: class I SAM-dependent methyltransferase [Polyangiaceae bacterium]